MIFVLQPKSIQKLKDFMLKVSAAINPNKCEDFVKSMPQRIKATIRANNENKVLTIFFVEIFQ